MRETFYPGWWPWCAVCDKHVERIAGYRDPSVPFVNVFEAMCHGEVQKTMLTDQQMIALARIRGGIAFGEPGPAEKKAMPC